MPGEKQETNHYDDLDAGTEWGTPPYIVEPLSNALGGFDLDPASGAEPKPYAETRFTTEEDGLSRPWFDDVWLNPPYSRKANPKWARKVTQEVRREKVETLTALIPAATDSDWFQNHYAKADYITLIDGRVEFVGVVDKSPTFASVLVSFGEFPESYVKALDNLGTVWSRVFEDRQSGVDDFV